MLSQKCQDMEGFLLVGGTALALQAAHRLSEDLDFAWPQKKLDRKKIQRILDLMAANGTPALYNNPIDKIDEAINDGIDLDDYHQDYLVDGVKLTFFAFGDYEADRDLIRRNLLSPARIGSVAIAEMDTLFVAKCIALTDRIKSRDIFDLHWLSQENPQQFGVQRIFEEAQRYRPHLAYEHLRYRLLDWPIPATDESFEALVTNPPTVQDIRDALRQEVCRMEEAMAARWGSAPGT
jgi:hypothetical protein